MTQAYHDALQPIVAEFKNICPGIASAYVFDSSGKTVATSEKSGKEQCQTTIINLDTITQAECIGGIENITIQGAHSQLSISSMSGLYLATVSSKEANQRIIKALVKTVVPTVVSLVDEIFQSRMKNSLLKKPKLENAQTEKAILPVEKPKTVKTLSKPNTTSTSAYRSVLPEAPVHQLMVEKIGGLLVPSDTVRIDSEMISRWRELYEGKSIMKVNVETLEGKSTTCKLKEIKKNGKGIIQVPEKVLQVLQASNGKLVKVKPVVE